MNIKKIIFSVFLTLGLCAVIFFRFIGFSGAPMFTATIKVELNPDTLIKLSKNTSDLEIENIRKSELRYLDQSSSNVNLSLRLEGLQGKEKFALLPSEWGKYETIDFWDLNVKRSDIKSSIKKYLLVNGVNEASIKNIDLSSFESRYRFKD